MLRLSFSLLAVFLLRTVPLSALDTFSLSEVSDLFPSAGLEERIEYWKKIFTDHGEKDFVFHDRSDLGLIYDEVRFSRPSRDDRNESLRQKRVLDEKVREIKENFSEIARHGPDSDRLNSDQRKVVKLLRSRGYSINATLMKRLQDNLRYQRGIKEKFETGLIRSGLYLAEILDVFNRYSLPEELAYLPHIESSFDYNAYSSAGAAGIWQFTRGTGRMYLEIGSYVDERLDPIRATDAAARLLRDNYAALGNWPLAITAYNHGKYGMIRAKNAHGPDIRNIIRSYSSRSFGFASQNFYAEFLAALEVARNYKQHFGQLPIAEPLRYDSVALDRSYRVSHLTRVPEISSGVLTAYNPHLQLYFRSSSRILPAGIVVRVPEGMADALRQSLAGVPASELKAAVEAGPGEYRVRPGDSLGSIARRFGSSVGRLQALNGIDNPNRIHPGQILRISDADRASEPANPSPGASAGRVAEYRVKPGDTLAVIAQRHQTTVAQLQHLNGLSNPHHLRPGQILKISESASSASASPRRYTVKRGDSLGRIAQQFGIPLRRLQEVNKIRDPRKIYPGQELHIP